jgi:thiol:disulfide interchange protein
MSCLKFSCKATLLGYLAGIGLVSNLFGIEKQQDDRLKTSQANSVATLVSDLAVLEPGGKIKIGLKIELAKGWHTYWQNPGDSASAPIFNFKLPKDYQVGPLSYPTPQRIPVAHLMSFAYENEVLLFSEITIPSREAQFIPENRVITLDAEWLVCREECIPAVFSFSMTLPLAEKAPLSAQYPLFEKAIANSPRLEISGFYETTGPEVIVHIKDDNLGELIDLFPYPDQPLTNRAVKITGGEGEKFLAQMLARGDAEQREISLLAVFEKGDRRESHTLIATSDQELPWMMLGFAFLGGLLLNLMPCVFPVLALKLLALVKLSDGDRSQLLTSNGFYLLGILVSFWSLGAAMILLRTSGELLGWGFQLQSPTFVFWLCVLFLVLGLNFWGWLELSGRFSSLGHSLTQRDGFLAPFFTGVLAVIVASPCTAPFMGVAMGYALTQGTLSTFMMFTSLGFGLAFPYLFFGFFPKAARFLPRPGPWMIKFKKFLALPMWATCLWLLWVLWQLEGFGQGLIVAVIALLFLIYRAAPRLLQILQITEPKWLKVGIVSLAFAGLALGSLWRYIPAGSASLKPASSAVEKDAFWQPFSEEILAAHIKAKRRVFINFTASWCITCQVNEKTTFENEEVRARVAQAGIIMLKADFTKGDEQIANILAEYMRAGVPLYLYFIPGNEVAILPEVLTPGIFLQYLK